MTRGIRNNNPLNIRRSKANAWQGKDTPPRDREFETFQDPVMGLRAGAVLIIAHYDRRGANTVRKLVTIWAPPAENDTRAYVDAVSQMTGFDPDQPLNFHCYNHLRPVIEAMIRVENGQQPYTDAQLDRALALAGVVPDPAPMTASRTVRGGAVATVATTGAAVLEALRDVREEASGLIEPMLVHAGWLKWALVGLTLASVLWMVWARIDDRRRLAR